jgi:hypothetical protein
VKLAGRSDVTVVWANALPAENANVEMKAATSEAAKRCEDIHDLSGAHAAKPVAGTATGIRANVRTNPAKPFGIKLRHRTPRSRQQSSRRREISLTNRHA